MRYFIQLQYKGTNYHGWQIQPNASSVQEELNMALSLLLKEEINVVGAGRTDTGVHASFFVAHFDVTSSISNLQKLTFKLNSFLDKDILIETIFQVDETFHARFSPVARTYYYFISRKKVPFLFESVAIVHYDLDLDKINEASEVLLEYTDFTSFSKLHTDVKTNNCKIHSARWFQQNGLLVFEITADRFLRNMVRAIVGTLIEVGRGKITTQKVREIIEKQDRGLAGASAKPNGLFLSDIKYPETIDQQLLRKKHFLL